MKLRLLSLMLLALATPMALHAQGCVNSPENPTAVLALVAIAGSACSAYRRRKN